MSDREITVEVEPVTVDVNGVMTITIPFDMYNSLMQTKGRYEEIKDGEEENKAFMEEYKQLLIIKGKYEELSAMFDTQFGVVEGHDQQCCEDTESLVTPLSVDKEVTCYAEEDVKCCEELADVCCCEAEESNKED